MSLDRTEQLVRDAFTEEASRAVDSREVLAAVRGRRPRRSYGLVLATAAVVVVVAAVATFVVPEVFRRSSVPPAVQNHAVTPTNVLVVGTDSAAYTDAIVLVQVGADGSVSLVSLPRDSWVSAAGKMTRLNTVYVQSGADALVATVGDLTGVRIDHYAVVEMAAVGALTDAVGGVPVCLRAPQSDPLAGADLPGGEQTLDGAAALAFLRHRRLPLGDLDRMVRLQTFLQSLALTMRSADLPAVVNAVRGHVRTDPDLDLLGLAGLLRNATALRVLTIPIENPDLQTPEGGNVLGIDPAAVKDFMADVPDVQPATGDVSCVP